MGFAPHAVPMAMHFAGSPISFMANVHCAAATENFVALEHHSLDVPWWGDLVTPPVVLDKGFAVVPDRPGLGVEPNPEVIKAIKASGLKVKTLIGGAPVTQAYADEVGADGYAPDAASAADAAKKLIGV